MPTVDSSIFNSPTDKPADPNAPDVKPTDNTDTAKHAEGNPVTDTANKDLKKTGTKKA